MATINTHKAKDGTITYRVRIQRKGHAVQTATFPTLKDAKKWAMMVEGQIIEGRHFPTRKTQHMLSESLDKYMKDVMPRKTPETQRSHQSVIKFWRERLGHKLLQDITREDVLQCRNELKERAPATICKYLVILGHTFKMAIQEYNWIDTNVVNMVPRPSLPPAKVRFLTDEERSRLLEECKRSKNQYLYALVSLGLYTCLRRSSLLNLKREDIDLKNRTLCIPKTKNKSTLILPIVGEAYEIIKNLCFQKTDKEYIFPGQEKGKGGWNHYDAAFKHALKRANISDFTFHTLRHTGASYMIQSGVPLYTVGAVLNHKNPATITHRYAHLATENLKGALEILARRLEK